MVEETALHFKRVVEAAVLRAHPEWRGSQVHMHIHMPTNALMHMHMAAVLRAHPESRGSQVYVHMHMPTAHARMHMRMHARTCTHTLAHAHAHAHIPQST